MKFLVVLLLSMRLIACGSSSSDGDAALVGASLGACGEGNRGQVSYDSVNKTLNVCENGAWTIIESAHNFLVKDGQGRSIGTTKAQPLVFNGETYIGVSVGLYWLSFSAKNGKSTSGCYYASTDCSGECLTGDNSLKLNRSILADASGNLYIASDTATSVKFADVKSHYSPAAEKCEPASTNADPSQVSYKVTDYIPSGFTYPISLPVTFEPSL